MDAAWVGVVGAAVGSAGTVLSQWAVHRRTSRAALRAERRDAYVDFLTAANRGMRVGEEMEHAERETKRIDEVLAHADAASSQDAIKAAGADHSVLRKRTAALREDADDFLRLMDRGLVVMHLASPVDLLGAGNALRAGIDAYMRGEISHEDLDVLYRRFTYRAVADLQHGLDAWALRLVIRHHERKQKRTTSRSARAQDL
jgi:hypothetical protein